MLLPGGARARNRGARLESCGQESWAQRVASKQVGGEKAGRAETGDSEQVGVGRKQTRVGQRASWWATSEPVGACEKVRRGGGGRKLASLLWRAGMGGARGGTERADVRASGAAG